MKNKIDAVSLVELLVSLAILSIIIALVVPQFVQLQQQAKLSAAQQQADAIAKATQAWTGSLGSLKQIGAKFGSSLDMPSTVFSNEVTSYISQADNLDFGATPSAGGIAYSTKTMRELPTPPSGQSFADYTVSVKGRSYIVSPATSTSAHVRIININREVVVAPFLTTNTGQGAVAGKTYINLGLYIVGSPLDANNNGNIGASVIPTTVPTNFSLNPGGTPATFNIVGSAAGITASAPPGSGLSVSVNNITGVVTVTASSTTAPGTYGITLTGPDGSTTTVPIEVKLAQAIIVNPRSINLQVPAGQTQTSGIMSSFKAIGSTMLVVGGGSYVDTGRNTDFSTVQPIVPTTPTKPVNDVPVTPTRLTTTFTISTVGGANKGSGLYVISGSFLGSGVATINGNVITLDYTNMAPGSYNIIVRALSNSVYTESPAVRINITVSRGSTSPSG